MANIRGHGLSRLIGSGDCKKQFVSASRQSAAEKTNRTRSTLNSFDAPLRSGRNCAFFITWKAKRVCGHIARCSELDHEILKGVIPERRRSHACLPTSPSPLLAQRAPSTVEAEGRRGGTTLTGRASHTMAGARHARWLHWRIARVSRHGDAADAHRGIGSVTDGVSRMGWRCEFRTLTVNLGRACRPHAADTKAVGAVRGSEARTDSRFRHARPGDGTDRQ